jgi:hypothetical protein
MQGQQWQQWQQETPYEYRVDKLGNARFVETKYQCNSYETDECNCVEYAIHGDRWEVYDPDRLHRLLPQEVLRNSISMRVQSPPLTDEQQRVLEDLGDPQFVGIAGMRIVPFLPVPPG